MDTYTHILFCATERLAQTLLSDDCSRKRDIPSRLEGVGPPQVDGLCASPNTEDPVLIPDRMAILTSHPGSASREPGAWHRAHCTRPIVCQTGQSPASRGLCAASAAAGHGSRRVAESGNGERVPHSTMACAPLHPWNPLRSQSSGQAPAGQGSVGQAHNAWQGSAGDRTV